MAVVEVVAVAEGVAKGMAMVEVVAAASGRTEGKAERLTEGLADGMADGVAGGMVDGVAEKMAKGAAEGEAKGTVVVAVVAAAEGIIKGVAVDDAEDELESKCNLLWLHRRVPFSSWAEGIHVVSIQYCMIIIRPAPGIPQSDVERFPLSLPNGLPAEADVMMGADAVLKQSLLLREAVSFDGNKQLFQFPIREVLRRVGFRIKTGQASKVTGVDPSQLCRLDEHADRRFSVGCVVAFHVISHSLLV